MTATTSSRWTRSPTAWVAKPSSHRTSRITKTVHSTALLLARPRDALPPLWPGRRPVSSARPTTAPDGPEPLPQSPQIVHHGLSPRSRRLQSFPRVVRAGVAALLGL